MDELVTVNESASPLDPDLFVEEERSRELSLVGAFAGSWRWPGLGGGFSSEGAGF
jgi:hypothetical protein